MMNWFMFWIRRTDTGGNRFELWLRKRARNALSRSAQKSLRDTANHLYRLKKYASPEEEESINRTLDEVLYPAIQMMKDMEV